MNDIKVLIENGIEHISYGEYIMTLEAYFNISDMMGSREFLQFLDGDEQSRMFVKKNSDDRTHHIIEKQWKNTFSVRAVDNDKIIRHNGFDMCEEVFYDICEIMGNDEFLKFIYSDYIRKTFVYEKANNVIEGAEFEYTIQKIFINDTKTLRINKHVTKEPKWLT